MNYFRRNSIVQTKHQKKKRIAVERADHIICISENTRRDLIELFKVPEEKTSVIYLGFDLNDKNNFKFKLPKEKIILYVGDRSGYKNFRNLVIAYARNKKLKTSFKLVAFGSSLKGSFRRQINFLIFKTTQSFKLDLLVNFGS